jgi:HEAT repeat protein
MRTGIIVVIFMLAVGVPAAFPTPLPEGLVRDLGSDNLPERFTAQQELWKMAAEAGAPDGQAAPLAEALLALAKDTAAPEVARLAALRPLESIGGGEAVRTLAELLGDPSPAIREAAREALEMNPAPEASAPLREALVNSDETVWTMGLAQSLLRRRDPKSLGHFRDLLGHQDKGVVRLAAQALGTLGGAEAVTALQESLPRLAGRERAVAESALIRAGAPPKVVEGLWPEAANAAVRCEIFSTLLTINEQAATRLVADVLAKTETPGAGQILREAVRGGWPAIADAVIKAEPQLPLDARLAVLGALADRHDTRPAATLAALLETADPRYRTALIALLGNSGTEAQIPLLLELANDRSPEIASAAGVALARMELEAVDQELPARMQAGTEEDRLAAIRLAAYRNPAGTEELLGRLLVDDPSASVRETALASLGVVGGIDTANLFLARIAAAPEAEAARPFQAEFRRMVPRLLSTPVIWREGFLPTYEAARTPELRVALLKMMPALRGPEAGKFLVRVVQDADSPERTEALQQLTGWTHVQAGPFMLEVAKAGGIDEKTRDAVFNALTRLFFPTAGGNNVSKAELADRVLAAAPDEATRQRVQQAIEDSKVRTGGEQAANRP